LVLSPHHWRTWLDGDAASASTLLSPPDPAALRVLEVRPVGPAVGDVRNDGPGLVERVSLVSAERLHDLTLF
jgi:putative SOS response-associated peptidase YedK